MKKTLRSRIAAVVVAAVGLGLLQAGPANAAATTSRTVTVSNDSTTYASSVNKSVNTGVLTSVDVKLITVGTSTPAGEVITITPAQVSGPTVSINTTVTAGSDRFGISRIGTSIAAPSGSDKWNLAEVSGTLTATGAGSAQAISAKVGDLQFSASVAGTYVFTVSVASDTGTGANTNATVIFTVTDPNGSGYSATTALNTSSISMLPSPATAATATVTTTLTGQNGFNLPAGAQVTITPTDYTDATTLLAAGGTATNLVTSGKIKFAQSATALAANTLTNGNASPTATATAGAYTVGAVNATASAAASVTLSVDTASVANGTYKIKLTTTDTGVGAPALSNPVYLTININNPVSRTLTFSPVLQETSLTVGGTASFTVTDAFTASADTATADVVISTADTSKISLSVAIGTVTGGTSYIDAGATGASVTVKHLRNSNTASDSYSAPLTVTVRTLPGLANAYGTATVTVARRVNGTNVPASGSSFTFNLVPTVPTYSYASAVLGASGTGHLVTAAKTVYAPKTFTGTPVASVTVAQNDAANAAITLPLYAKAWAASITGVGTFANGGSCAAGLSTQFLAAPAQTSVGGTLYVCSDGRGGTGTISVTVDGVTLPALTVKFYGEATTITATVLKPIGKAGTGAGWTGSIDATNGSIQTPSGTNDPAIAVSVVDDLGIPVPASTLKGTSSKLTSLANTTSMFIDSGNGVDTAGVFMHHFRYTTNTGAKSGDSATFTFTAVKTDGTIVSSSPVTIKFGGTVPASVSFTTWNKDATALKDTFAPGEQGTLLVTVKDVDGNLVADGTYADLLDDVTTTNVALSGASLVPGTSVKVADGVKTYSFFAPLTAGVVTFTNETGVGTAVVGTAVTASITVVDAVAEANKAAIEAARAEAAKATAAVEAAKAAAAADALKAQAAIEAAKAEAAKATAAAEAAKAAAAADAAKAAAAIAAVSATVTSIQTAMSTLVASVTATLASMSAQIAKIMKKLNIK